MPEASVVDEHVGRQIRLRRQLLGLSQDHLARIVGLAQQQLMRHERGVRVTASRLYALARALDVPVEFFFEGLELPGGGRVSGSDASMEAGGSRAGAADDSRDALAVVRAFRRIDSPKGRKAVLDLMKQLGSEEE